MKVTITGINDFGVVGTTNGEGTLSANAVTHGIAYAASSCYPYPTYALIVAIDLPVAKFSTLIVGLWCLTIENTFPPHQ